MTTSGLASDLAGNCVTVELLAMWQVRKDRWEQVRVLWDGWM